MRPVDKGTAPRVYTDYQQALPDLVDRLGEYCSYCERRIETNLAVEHVCPKSLDPSMALDWINLLLGCVNCNSTKKDKPVVLDDYVWPDRDNTLRAFLYSEGGMVSAHPHLHPDLQSRAARMIWLVGLDKTPGHPEKSRRPVSHRDKRWDRRFKVWNLAIELRADLSANDIPVVRKLIVDVALAEGMYSLWMTVFAEDTDMRHRFTAAFQGTAADCFDADSQSLPRSLGLC